jgi:hypothetical protein
VFEVRGVKLRRQLGRKKVDGWARAAMRSIEDDDIRKWVGWDVVLVVSGAGFKNLRFSTLRGEHCPVLDWRAVTKP